MHLRYVDYRNVWVSKIVDNIPHMGYGCQDGKMLLSIATGKEDGAP
jgi:hypothetical protein